MKISKLLLSLTILSGTVLSLTQAKAEVTPPVEAGPDQVVIVRTIPAESGSAHCMFRNKAGEDSIPYTPFRVDLMKASGTMDIRCISSDGLWVGHMQLKAKMDGSFQSIINLPFTGLFAANSILNDFNDPIEGAVGSAVKYPSIIEVPMHLTIERINNATAATEADAIANAPEQPIVESPQAPVSTPKHHKKHIVHHIYHTEDSHS